MIGPDKLNSRTMNSIWLNLTTGAAQYALPALFRIPSSTSNADETRCRTVGSLCPSSRARAARGTATPIRVETVPCIGCGFMLFVAAAVCVVRVRRPEGGRDVFNL